MIEMQGYFLQFKAARNAGLHTEYIGNPAE